MDDTQFNAPLSQLPEGEKATRAASFGAFAGEYERFRPGPPAAALDWILPGPVATIVDLGAGTGAVTRLLVDRADDVVAVEPDDRMRAILTERLPGVRAVKGHGESMPLPNTSADAVIAATSWHWMEPVSTLQEVARVLVPGGALGVLWAGPDPDGAFLAQARALIAQRSSGDAGEAEEGSGELRNLIMGDATRPDNVLEIPAGAPFAQPEQRAFTWDVALDADELVGLLSTFSWIITLDDDTRAGVFAEARRLLKEFLGVEGDVTVDVAFRAAAYRTVVRS